MKTIGNCEFPETPEESAEWKHTVIKRALSSTALVVAHTRQEGAWCAYCKGVPGINHNYEATEVLHDGDKLEMSLAQFMFPYFEGIPYAH